MSLDLLTTQHVNFEAREAFLKAYTKCFHNLGQRPILINFDIDTLCFKSGLRTLNKFIRQYPEAMSKVKFIEISSRVPQLGTKIDFTPLKALQKLTVQWTPDEIYTPSNWQHRKTRMLEILSRAVEEAAKAGMWAGRSLPELTAVDEPLGEVLMSCWCGYHIWDSGTKHGRRASCEPRSRAFHTRGSRKLGSCRLFIWDRTSATTVPAKLSNDEQAITALATLQLVQSWQIEPWIDW